MLLTRLHQRFVLAWMGAAEQDRFGQRAMDRRVEAGDRRILLDHTSAPPPN